MDERSKQYYHDPRRSPRKAAEAWVKAKYDEEGMHPDRGPQAIAAALLDLADAVRSTASGEQEK